MKDDFFANRMNSGELSLTQQLHRRNQKLRTWLEGSLTVVDAGVERAAHLLSTVGASLGI